MSSIRVHLVRHGEVENPHHVVYGDLPGYRLSDTGLAQAAAAAEYLSNRPVTHVVASPLLRARQTADAIAARHSLATRTDDRLTEWGGGVRWAGVAWSQLDEVFPGELTAYLEDPLNIIFGNETLQACGRRAAQAARDWATRANGGHVVLIAHQDTIHAAHLELIDQWRADYHADKPEHASVITLEPRPGAWTHESYWAPPQGEPFPPLE